MVITEFPTVTIYLETPVSLGFTRARPVYVWELRPFPEIVFREVVYLVGGLIIGALR